MGHLLTEELEQSLLSRGQHSLEREASEVDQRRRECERHSAGESVYDISEDQRRQERRQHRRGDAENRSDRQELM